MSLDRWTESWFRQLYSRQEPGKPHATRGYTRHLMLDIAEAAGSTTSFRERARNLPERFAWTPETRILIVGCAFGFTIEKLHAAGFPNVVGIDNSPYVHANADQIADGVTVHAEDVRHPDLPSIVGRFDWVVTEDVVACYDDADLPSFLDACERLAVAPERVVHLTSYLRNAGQVLDSALNGKMMDEWRAVRPSHTWLGSAGRDA